MKLTETRVVDDLTDHLRARILSGEFPALAKISENGLANEYGVARPTARSACDVLVGEGLLTRAAFAAVRVPKIGEDEMPQILAILNFVEEQTLGEMLVSLPDLRPLTKTDSESVHSALDQFVTLTGSTRLIHIHRKTTFECLLGLQQLGAKTKPWKDPNPIVRTLAEALFRDDARGARNSLNSLQEIRNSLCLTTSGRSVEAPQA